MRVHKAAVLGDCAQAVGIAIGGKSRLAAFAYHGLLQQRDVRLNRFGVDPRKQRIQFAANFNVIDAVLGEDALDYSASRTVHRIDCKLETRLS